jgi:hypothetical protein
MYPRRGMDQTPTTTPTRAPTSSLLWNLVVQLVEAGDKIPDLSPTMKAFIEEARKIKMKVAP